jgi:hypothetical protein
VAPAMSARHAPGLARGVLVEAAVAQLFLGAK